MTPKEKAKELYKYEHFKFVEELLSSGLLIPQPKIDKANKIKTNKFQIEYWKEVKKELKKYKK